jgi:hypothetical protein
LKLAVFKRFKKYVLSVPIITYSEWLMGEDNENLYPFGMASGIKYRLRAMAENAPIRENAPAKSHYQQFRLGFCGKNAIFVNVTTQV